MHTPHQRKIGTALRTAIHHHTGLAWIIRRYASIASCAVMVSLISCVMEPELRCSKV